MSQNKTTPTNVIQMPERPKKKGERRRFDLEQKRVTVAASLVSVLLLVMIANNNIWKEKEEAVVQRTSASRDVASLAPLAPEQELMWQSEIVSKLAAPARKRGDGAQASKRATENDKFLYGTLRGLYSAEMRQGKIVRVQYRENGEILDTPVFVEGRELFEKHKDLFPVSFASFSLQKQIKESDSVKQLFTLLDSKRKPVAEVEIRRDAFDRLLSLAIRSSKE